jgi:tRNA threonylcarbamoyladenosine biosynthesis protein TsaE
LGLFYLGAGREPLPGNEVKVAITRYYELQSEQDTIDLAERLAPLLRPGDLICLLGDLGAGKTFFAQALGRFLGAEEELDSPSFMLLKEYACRDFPLYHIDLYRLRHPGELLDLGIHDLIETGVTLIEWPQRAGNLIPEHDLELRFSFDGSRRGVEITAGGRFAAHFS